MLPEEAIKKIESGEITCKQAANKLGIAYTTAMSRKYRGKSLLKSFSDPVNPRRGNIKGCGNTAWQSLGD